MLGNHDWQANRHDELVAVLETGGIHVLDRGWHVCVGEPPRIWGNLGADRLAPPIAEHEPDLVLHGHAHAGTFRARSAVSLSITCRCP